MRNHYCLNPGEFFVAQQLALKRTDLHLYFPLEDEGWDLLAVNHEASRIVKVQVKESRAYPKNGRSWHQVKKERIKAADVFIFVTYVPTSAGARLEFETQFLIIPGDNLLKMCLGKAAGKKEIYSFYFIKRGEHVLEEREAGKPLDVTEYYDAWNLV
jgi:hypothetical protein